MSCTDRCSGKGLDRDRDLASLQIIHEFTGDVGPFGFVARAPAASFLRLDELFAIDVDEVLARMQDTFKEQPMNTVDGVKIEFGKEWVHLRKSNTEPIIRIYAESTSAEAADALAQKIMAGVS